MEMQAVWKITGMVMELRELTSKKNEAWRGYVAKIGTFGQTLEVQLDDEQFKALHTGAKVTCQGRFEDVKGYIRLVVTKVGDLAQGN